MKGVLLLTETKNKKTLYIMMSTLLIFIIGGLLFYKLYTNYQNNQSIIQKCFDKFDQSQNIVIQKNGFWSPVKCQKINE